MFTNWRGVVFLLSVFVNPVISQKEKYNDSNQKEEKFDFNSCKKDKITGIELSSVCSEYPNTLRRWSIYNPNPYWLFVHYRIDDSNIKGKVICPPAGMADPAFPGDTINNYTFIITKAISGENTMKIKYGNGQEQETLSNAEKCFIDQKWSLNGNETDENSFLGTKNNSDLKIKTNDSLRVLVGKNGEVNILQDLEVNQKITANNLQIKNLVGTDGDMVVVDSLGNFYTKSIENDTIVFKNIQITDALNIGTHTLHLTGNPDVDNVGGQENTIYTTAGDLYIQSYNDAFNTILNARQNTGSVGIGTDTPDSQYKLDVAGNVNISKKLFVNGNEVKNEPFINNSNLALNKTPVQQSAACSNGFCPNYSTNKDYVVDGKVGTYWVSGFSDAHDTYPQYLIINLGKKTGINKVIVKAGTEGFIGDQTTLYSSDNGTDFTLISENNETASIKTFELSNVETKFVKIEFKDTYSAVFQIDEIEVYGEGTPGLWSKEYKSKNVFYNEGNVGVKNTNPEYTLDVDGDINYTGKLLKNGEELKPIEQSKSDGSDLIAGATSSTQSTGNNQYETIYDLGSKYLLDRIELYWKGFTPGESVWIYQRYAWYSVSVAAEPDNYTLLFNQSPGCFDAIQMNSSSDIITINSTEKIRYIKFEYNTTQSCAFVPHFDGLESFEKFPSADFYDVNIEHELKSPPLYVVNGKVGINTETPDASSILDVNGNEKVQGTLKVTGDIYQNGKLLTPLWEENSGNLFTNTNVGIGTAPCSDIALKVNGTIMAEKVMVRDPVPSCDFVFDNDYKLLSIAAVDSFIAVNKHLPGVKSAKAFKEGYSLNEMDAVLLEKIEQLYLYISKLNKEIEDLKRDKTNTK